MVVAEIVETVWRAALWRKRRLHNRNQRRDNIVDIREIATQPAATEHRKRLLTQNRIGEEPIGHVRPSPGPGPRDEPPPRLLQPDQLRIGMRQQLASSLGGAIVGNRLVGARTFRKWR